MAITPSDNAIFNADELNLLNRIGKSKLWRLMQDALVGAREDLFSGTSQIYGLHGQPSTNEALWQNRGATLLIQYLLQNGPLFVVLYQRQKEADEQERISRKAKQKMPEREYTPTALTETPDFDL
jgi:hypothetical protein